MQNSIFLTISLGFALGLKHAMEADHLAAVSTIVSERRSIWESARVGVLWGLGHSTSLLFAGLLVIGLGVVIPERVASLLEFAVAIMIVFWEAVFCISPYANSSGCTFTRTSRLAGSHFHLHFHSASDAHPVVQTHASPHSGLSRWRTFPGWNSSMGLAGSRR
jgi:ABC-type nickel/cobalt efflux system permease component RcnA